MSSLCSAEESFFIFKYQTLCQSEFWQEFVLHKLVEPWQLQYNFIAHSLLLNFHKNVFCINPFNFSYSGSVLSDSRPQRSRMSNPEDLSGKQNQLTLLTWCQNEITSQK